MDISYYTDELLAKDGIWIPKGEINEISYPEDGNAVCYQLEENSFWFNHRNQCIARCLENFHNQSDTFFDIGGGNGFVSKYLQNNGYSVCLVEPGIQGVQNAKSRLVENVVHGTLESAKFKKNTIDSIGLFDVVEHIEDSEKFIQNINEYLKPNGKVFITVPAFNSLWSVNDVIAGHYKRYTTKSLSDLLEQHNFKMEYCSYMFRPLVAPLWIMRTIPSKLGMLNEENVRSKTLKHHNNPKKGGSGFLNKLLNKELQSVKELKSINFGTSCLAVASKI